MLIRGNLYSMLKLSLFIFFSILITVYCLLSTPIFARTTPADIINDQLETYNSRIQNYSPANKQKLNDWNKKIADFNSLKTTALETICLSQGLILDEFIRRNEVSEKLKTDGKTRNLSDPIENARYWLTYAHEAVAYQAAHVYVFNITGESAINQNILSTINGMESDLNVLRGKVQKSQNIVAELVNKNEI